MTRNDLSIENTEIAVRIHDKTMLKIWTLASEIAETRILVFIMKFIKTIIIWGAGVVQWCERSPPTNLARVRFLDPASLLLLLLLSLLLVLVLAPRVFLRVLPFSSLHKN